MFNTFQFHIPSALTDSYVKKYWPSYTIDYKATRSQKSHKAKRKKKKNNKAKNFAKLSKLKAKWESYLDYNEISYPINNKKQFQLWGRVLYCARNVTKNFGVL